MEKHLSRNLKWLLKKYQITTSELARRCQISQPVLHRLVTDAIDNPQIDTLVPLCNYFNCTLDTLVFENLEEKNKEFPLSQTEIRHIMRNNLLVINSLVQVFEKTLPIFTQSYLTLPKEFRIGEISEEMISMIPNMLSHTIEAVATLRAAIKSI